MAGPFDWLTGPRNSLLDGAPMYQGGPQASAATDRFVAAPNRLLDYARRVVDPQTPDERMAANVVRGFTESPASMRAPPGYVTAYHGGPGSYEWSKRGAIDEFNIGPEGATFFSSQPERAAEYAVARYGDRPATYPVHLDQGAMVTHDAAQRYMSNPDLIEWAKSQNANVVRVQNAMDAVTDGGAIARMTEALGRKPYSGAEVVYMVLDPTAIRYPFGKQPGQ